MTKNEIYKRIWKLQEEASDTTLNRKQYEAEIRSLYKLLYDKIEEEYEYERT